MRVEDSPNARVFTIHDVPKLDPVTVVLQDFEHGKGRLIIECWGETWSTYWGGMGTTLADFIVSCGYDYILNKLITKRITKADEAHLQRIVVAVQEALREGLVK